MFTHVSRRCSGSSLSLEVKRQLFHLVLISLWGVPIYYFPFWVNALLFAVVLVVNLLVVLKVRPFLTLFGFLIKELERERNLERPGIQSLYANLGILTAYLLFGKLALVGVFTLAVGDSVSTLAGKLLGRHPLFYNPRKTWEGCAAFFLSVFAVLTPFLGVSAALLIASISALLESLNHSMDDNLLIPITATAVAYLLW